MRNKNVTIQLITFTYTILAIALSLLIYSCTQPKEKDYTIGIINPNPGLTKVTDGFICGLNRLGYMEGKNITYMRHELSDYFPGINLKTAKASGPIIPDDILQQADDIIR